MISPLSTQCVHRTITGTPRLITALCLAALCACSGDRDQSTVSSSTSADSGATAPADLSASPPAMSMTPDPPPLPPSTAPDSLIALAAAPDSLLDRLATHEYGYDERGLMVHDTTNGWLLVVTTDSAREWIRASAVDSLYALPELMVERLTYLTKAWDGTLRAQPDFAAPRLAAGRSWRAAPPDQGETPTRVLRSEVRNGTLWFEVAVLTSSVCDGETPRTRATGWVPAYGTGRAPAIWFFSRGC